MIVLIFLFRWGKMGFMKNYKIRSLVILFLGLILILGFSACAPQAPTEITATLPAGTTPTQPEAATEPPPTVTPTPEDPVVILLHSADADPFAKMQIQSKLEELTTNSGLQLVIQEALSAEMMAADVKVVAGVGPGIDVNSLAASYPGVSFLAVDNPSAQPSANLTVIGDPVDDQKRRAFMAGYLAALISDDYKVAALAPADTSSTDMILDSFVVGARFYCGLCQPKYPPYKAFPQVQSLPVGETVETYQPVLDILQANGVQVIFVHADLASSPLLARISEMDMVAVSDQRPEITSNNYVGTVLSDPGPSLEFLWPSLLNADQGFWKAASITLVDLDSGLLSEGRYQYFLEMAGYLEEELVFPEIVP